MKANPPETDALKELLKKHGTFIPSEGFSARLMHTVVTNYKFSYSKQYRKQERLGKWIVLILIACNVLIFVKLKPSVQVLEIVCPVFSLALGVGILIFMIKKITITKQN